MENILLVILIAIIAGWLATRIMERRRFALIGSLLISFVGALLGSFIFQFVGIPTGGLLTDLIMAIVGAEVLL
jgi:uncharacterized membrane protein YeaQ/YmgE (transglycosylase-associated protein family)